MKLAGKNFVVEINEQNGNPTELLFCDDSYRMNWIRNDYTGVSVIGYQNETIEANKCEISVIGFNSDRTVKLTINRFIKDGKYCEEYIFKNTADSAVSVDEDNTGIVFPYNCLFDKKENMLHTRCNSHVWCAGEVCKIQSVKLDGTKPYLIQKAVKGHFAGYGLLCDIAVTPNASFDRGYIVLYPQATVLAPGEEERLCFEFYFSDKREELSFVTADKYSGFLQEEFRINVKAEKVIESISAECENKEIVFETNGKSAWTTLKFDKLGEKKLNLTVNRKSTFIKLNILRPLQNILESRVKFIAEKQQFLKSGSKLDGAYLIFDRATNSLYHNADFPNHNSARERLSMGALMALSLRICYDKKREASLRKHREFIECEILDLKSGFVNDGVNRSAVRLYNFPWVSTYYLEWYNFSKDIQCLLTAARVLHKYYELGGADQEPPCIEAYEILQHLKSERLFDEYEKLKKEFIAHADSILERRTHSSSHEVSCANGMMNLMSTFLFQAFLLTEDKKYLKTTEELLKISESFFDCQPDFKMYGIALRYWDMYWFGKYESYGDTYPQWLSALTAQMYYFCDMATGQEHKRLIRDNLLGNCCVYFSDGFAACGYLYPKKIKVFSSDPKIENPSRPLGEWKGERFDDFANDQDWSLYYAVKYLCDFS